VLRDKSVVRALKIGGEEQSTLEPINMYWNFFPGQR
jgi:hypothetical protein